MKHNALSDRERVIAEAYSGGETYHQVAERLGLAPATIRTHLATIYRKLRVSSKIDLHRALEGEQPRQKSTDEQAALISELALSLEEAISRERALSEVLQIISRSDGNLDDVISAVLSHALSLCDAEFGILFSFEAARGFKATHMKRIPAPFQAWLTEQDWFHVSDGTGLGRLAASRQTINIIDVRSEDIYKTGDPLRFATADLGGARSFTAIPMIARDSLIGAFTIYRQQVRPFDDGTLSLARIFADQSVIAIENAKLVSALRKRTE